MSGLGRRLRAERDLWQAVWRHVDTFLDRIASAVDDDTPHVQTMCALFPVFNVIESARLRSVGYRIAAALAATPGGLGASGQPIATVHDGDLTSGQRIPGVEDCEFAVAGYRVTEDGKLDDPPWALLSHSIPLARFRDEKHGEVVLRTPTYDFGDLAGEPMVAVRIGDDGLFPKPAREEAIKGAQAKFTSWRDRRNDRVTAARTLGGSTAVALSARLAALTVPPAYPPARADLIAIGTQARAFATQCHADAAVLHQAKAALAEAAVAGDVSGAIAAAALTMTQQALDFDRAATRLSSPAVDALGYGDLIAVGRQLATAEGLPGPTGLPVALERLDAAAALAMNEAVENRIGYPDGPLRQLRMLQGTLRFFWEHRTAWMTWRHSLVLAPLHAAYLRGFTESLQRVLAGQPSGIPLPASSLVGKQTLIGATEIPLSSLPDLTSLVAGQLVVVGGARPTAAPVVDVLFDGKKLPPMRLKIPPLVVSVATGKDLPGVPGLVALATPLGDRYRRLDDDELRRGANRDGPAGDAIVQALVTHRSRLALVLGDAGGGTGHRPATPAIARPYPGIHRFDLEGPVTPADNRLFLTAVPAPSSSGTGEALPIAGPGEILLLHGRDQDGVAWQTAVEVDRVEITTGGAAKRDEEAGATPVPPCCGHDQPVMVVYVRSMPLPSGVQLSGAFLHRSFAGFGPRSLVTAVVLPETLDPDTSSTVQVGADTLRPRRDPELHAAVRVFDDWTPKETA